VTPCILTKKRQNSGGNCCFLLQIKLPSFYTEDIGSKFITGNLYLYFGVWVYDYEGCWSVLSL